MQAALIKLGGKKAAQVKVNNFNPALFVKQNPGIPDASQLCSYFKNIV